MKKNELDELKISHSIMEFIRQHSVGREVYQRKVICEKTGCSPENPFDTEVYGKGLITVMVKTIAMLEYIKMTGMGIVNFVSANKKDETNGKTKTEYKQGRKAKKDS